MIILNNKADELHIIIRSTEPKTDREAIMKALIAAVRWNGIATDDLKNAGGLDNWDGANLIVLSDLLNDMVEIKEVID